MPGYSHGIGGSVSRDRICQNHDGWLSSIVLYPMYVGSLAVHQHIVFLFSIYYFLAHSKMVDSVVLVLVHGRYVGGGRDSPWRAMPPHRYGYVYKQEMNGGNKW